MMNDPTTLRLTAAAIEAGLARTIGPSHPQSGKFTPEFLMEVAMHLNDAARALSVAAAGTTPTLQTVWVVQTERGCPEEGDPMTWETDGVFRTQEEADAARTGVYGSVVTPEHALVFGDRFARIETRAFSAPQAPRTPRTPRMQTPKRRRKR